MKGRENALWQISSTDGGSSWGSVINGKWKPGVWGNLGGALAAAPAAISVAPNRVDVFAAGKDGNIGRRWWVDGVWNGWQPLGHPPSGTVTSAPAVESRTENGLLIFDVFVQGHDNFLWQISSTDGGSSWGSFINGKWQPGVWGKLVAPVAAAPAAISFGADRIDVFAADAVGNIRRLWWEAAEWHGWQLLGHPSSGGATSAPAVEARTGNGSQIFDVFVKGHENALWQISSTDGGSSWGSFINGQWQPGAWGKLGGVLAAAPAVALSVATNGIDVFGVGADGSIGRRWWVDGAWHGWQPVGHPPSGAVTTAPAVAWRQIVTP